MQDVTEETPVEGGEVEELGGETPATEEPAGDDSEGGM